MYSQKNISRTIFHNKVKILKIKTCFVISKPQIVASNPNKIFFKSQYSTLLSNFESPKVPFELESRYYCIDHGFSGTHYSTQLQANTLAFW